MRVMKEEKHATLFDKNKERSPTQFVCCEDEVEWGSQELIWEEQGKEKEH